MIVVKNGKATRLDADPANGAAVYENGRVVYLKSDASDPEDAHRRYLLEMPYDELVNDLIRKRYSISQEFAILRQKEEKPEEYAAYFAYCEECKELVKAMKEDP